MIASLADYLNSVRNLMSYWGLDQPGVPYHEAETLWFRGHRDSSWKLTPKLYRDEYKDADENEIRQEFESRALQLIQGRTPTGKWEWYFLMQHYGAPTRLLDWTDNPLLGLYFAVADHDSKDRDAAVWTLNPHWLNRKLRRGIEGAMLPDWKEANSYLKNLEQAFEDHTLATARLPAAIDPPHVDRRLAAQSSRFVIFGVNRDLMQVKAIKSELRRKRHLQMISIPREAIPAIQKELYSCGITHSFVFPDLEGLCREICRKQVCQGSLLSRTGRERLRLGPVRLDCNRFLQRNQKS
jgi:hypothetical protein